MKPLRLLLIASAFVAIVVIAIMVVPYFVAGD